MGIKRVMSLLSIACIAFSGCAGPLAKNNWDKYAHEELSALIKENGSSSETYNASKKPYAVFDFDDTSIIGDIGVATMIYQLDNLELRISPEGIWSAFTDLFHNIDAPIAGMDAVSPRMLATDILNDYNYLYDKYISGREMSLEDIRKTDEFKDFRAKTYALCAASDALGYETGCLWILRLFNGMTKDEVREVAAKAAEDALKVKKIHKDVWESPKTGEAGKVRVEVTRGLGIPEEMTDLYRALTDNGIEVYICSASMKEVVEAVACNPEYGFNLPPENVFGIMLKGGGIIRAAYDPNYIPTFKEGKVRCIRRFIAPNHGGNDPVLVGGDSNGDYEMLTYFEGLKAGLIINCERGGNIAELSSRAMEEAGKDLTGTRYLLQGRNYAKKKFVKGMESRNKLAVKK